MSLADAKPNAAYNYPLNEANGNAVETIGGLDASDTNSVLSDTGLFGLARDFEAGNSERFIKTDAAAISVADIDFCLALWIKPESTGLKWILAKGDSDSANSLPYSINLDASTQVRFIVGSSAASTILTATTFGSLSVGTTYLVVCKHDSANNLIGISINGGAYQTIACSHGAFNDASSLVIGDLRSGGSLPYDGLMEDLTMLKGYLLSEAECAELWNSGAGVAFADWDAGGGSSVSVELATEQDLALSLTWSKTKSTSLSTEQDLALAATWSKALAAGLSAEQDLALSATWSKDLAIGLATEQDLAQTISITSGLALGQATEQDLALTATWSKTKSIGLAAEQDLAFSILVHTGTVVPAGSVSIPARRKIVSIPARRRITQVEERS